MGMHAFSLEEVHRENDVVSKYRKNIMRNIIVDVRVGMTIIWEIDAYRFLELCDWIYLA
jgi:hypothetical protein